MSSWAEWLVTVMMGGVVCAAAFAATAQPLQPLGLLSFSFWILAVIILIVGLLTTLVLIDLKRAFLAAPGVAVVATLTYVATLMAPAVEFGHYTSHLWNYALVQSVPVVIVTLVLMALGAMSGTVINTSVREYDL